MNDYIKREDAIEQANMWSMFGPDNMVARLKRLPRADVVEVKHGKWIKAADDGVWSYADAYAECDQCHKVTFNGWDMNFCPNCGALMRENEDE